MASLNTYLNDLSYNYYIGKSAIERQSINTSINTLISRLKNYFGSDLNDVMVFGSWKRDTALPRFYDQNSDIDILIIIDHQRLNLTPNTYREWLLKFANSKYPTSVSAKNFPTVRIDLQHITLDLVPAKIEKMFLDFYYIPSGANQWMQTYPFSFNKRVIQENQNKLQIVKPALRLIKAWNANARYPFDSYDLEQKAIDALTFSYTLEDGFFNIGMNLPWWSGTIKRNSEVQKLRTTIQKTKHYLKQGQLNEAKNEVHKVLPR